MLIWQLIYIENKTLKSIYIYIPDIKIVCAKHQLADTLKLYSNACKIEVFFSPRKMQETDEQ